MAPHEKFRFSNSAAFRSKIEELGLTIPFSPDISPLLQPGSISGRPTCNRLAVHPMEGADAEPDGRPGSLTYRRYERFGAGGCGLIWFEAAAVVPEGRSNPHQLQITPRNLDGFKQLVGRTREAADRAGRITAPLLLLQLTHSGRFSKPNGIPAPIIARRDPALDALHRLSPDHPLVSDESLDRLRGDFLRAADLAADAGFDGVDIKACHGYLVGELLASRTRREGRYGGPFENRTRFLVETTAKIKAARPELLLACRLGVYDGLVGGFGVPGNGTAAKDLWEPLALVRRLIEAGLSILNITAGIPAYRPHFGRPCDQPIPGSIPPPEHPLESVARLIRLASEIQKANPDLPVVGTGYSWLRGFFPATAAGAVRDKCASFIGLGRLAIAYPDFARDLTRDGRLDSRRMCTACSGCSVLLRAGGPSGCVVRDAERYKLSGPDPKPSSGGTV